MRQTALRLVLAALAALVALGGSLLAAPAARADDPVFDRAFGAGPADVCTTTCRAGSNGGVAGQLNFPYGTAVSGGEVYVADGNQRISVYGADGRFARAFGKAVNPNTANPDVCTAATSCRAGTRGGAAGQLDSPYAVAVSGGEVYVADASNNRISVFSTNGVFVRAFGRNVNAGSGDPDVCTSVCRAGSSGSAPGELSFPLGVAISAGEVFVSDASNNRVNVYAPGGAFLRSFGGAGSGAGQLGFPFGLTVSGGEVYVADQNNQRVSVFGVNGTFARAFGKGVNPTAGDPDVCTALTTCRAGTVGGSAGQLRAPLGVAVAGGEVFVADNNHRVSAFTTGGTFARAFGEQVNPGFGDRDLCTVATGCQSAIAGGTSGQLNSPTAIAVGGTELFVADTSNFRVAVFTAAGGFARAFGKSVTGSAPFVCTTVTGCGPGAAGPTAGQLNMPFGVAVAGGEAYVADQSNHRVSVYTADGTFARAFGDNVNAGTGNPDVCTSASTCRAGTSGIAEGQLSSPAAVAVSGGEVYVVDQNNHRISVFATDGTFARAFGGHGGGAGQLDNPAAVAVSGGEVFVSDQGNRRISVFVTSGVFARAFAKGVNAGNGTPDICSALSGCRPGTEGAAAAQLNGPFGLAVAGSEVYVADYFNGRVSVFGTGGAFARAFGRGVNAGTSGNPDVCTTATTCRAGSQGGSAGQLAFPFGVGVSDGAVYVSERFNARISVFGTDGAFARGFGSGVNAATSGNPDVCVASCRAAAQGDGAGQFMEPLGVAVSGTRIYVADRLNHRVSVFRVPRTEISSEPGTLAFGARDVEGGATATQTATITNTGTENVNLTGLALAGDTTQFARLTGAASDCAAGTELDPGEACGVRLRFDPTTTGPKSATLSITSNAPAVTVALTGSGTRAQLTRLPATLAFGTRDVDLGATPEQSTTIANTGTEAVAFTGLTLTGQATQFVRLTGAANDCTATTVLAAGQACTIRMRFDPSSIGPKAATLSITSNAPATSVALSGEGVQTELIVDPPALAFGARDVDLGAAGVQNATVANTGTETVTLTGLAFTGDTAHFGRLSGGTGDCATTTRLAAGDSCSLRLRFDPTSTGAKAATITIASNAPPQAVVLTGNGIQTQLASDPATLDFGARAVTDGAATRTATIVNTGTETVALTGLALTGDVAPFERLTGAAGECGSTTMLEAGQSCTVRVRFDPASTGAKAASLTVASNAPALVVGLTGIGTVAATPSDADGDGYPDDADPDDDNDGVPDTGDAFPRNPAETADNDSDGIGNNADPDDDNDHVPDELDAYPLDPTRHAAPQEPPPPLPPPPPPVVPAALPPEPGKWRLKKTGRVRVTERGGVVRIASGYVAVCPADGAGCSGRLTLKLVRRSAKTRKPVPIFLTAKARPVTIAAGAKRKIGFRLNDRGRALLRRYGPFTAVMRGVVAVAGQPAVARRAKLKLAAPAPPRR